MLRFLGLCLLLSNFLALTTTAGYDGYKIYDVIPKTRHQCDLLHELSKQENSYDFFSLSKVPERSARVMINPNVEENFLQYLQKHAIEHQLVNDDVGKTVQREFQVDRLLRVLKPSSGKGRLNTDRYYSQAEINNYIEDLAVRYPSRVFLKVVGKSFEGRLIKTIKITNGDGRTNKKINFMDGAFHAREWISPAAVLYVIEQLVENFEENAELLLDYDWIVLPVVNPDGYEYTRTAPANRYWRKTRQPLEYLGQTCYGTDPNRNFDFHWNEEGASSVPCADTFAGPKPFSEPETIIVRDIMHSLKGSGVMYLTLHSFGNYLLYPWGWTSDLPDTWEDLDEVARAGGDAIKEATGTDYEVGSSTNVLYIAAGASDDYAFYAGFPISITMELPGPGSGLGGFDPPASDIDRLVKETWIGIRAMAKKVVEKYPLEKHNTLKVLSDSNKNI